MKMFNYLDAKTQVNVNDYSYKNFHNSYDHDNQYQHLYNWVSVHPSDHVEHKEMTHHH